MRLFYQKDAADCGPACLAMILKHYGLFPNMDRLRQICGLSKDGVSLLGISIAAEEIGVRTVGGRMTFETLSSEASLPCIVHWDQNHFVVVYKIKKHSKGRYSIHVADPGKGFIIYSKKEFCYSDRKSVV